MDLNEYVSDRRIEQMRRECGICGVIETDTSKDYHSRYLDDFEEDPWSVTPYVDKSF